MKGANQPQAGHVTGHADLKSYQIFFKNLQYMQMLYGISYQCNNAILMNKQSCRFLRTRSAILPTVAWFCLLFVHSIMHNAFLSNSQ